MMTERARAALMRSSPSHDGVPFVMRRHVELRAWCFSNLSRRALHPYHFNSSVAASSSSRIDVAFFDTRRPTDRFVNGILRAAALVNRSVHVRCGALDSSLTSCVRQIKISITWTECLVSSLASDSERVKRGLQLQRSVYIPRGEHNKPIKKQEA